MDVFLHKDFKNPAFLKKWLAALGADADDALWQPASWAWLENQHPGAGESHRERHKRIAEGRAVLGAMFAAPEAREYKDALRSAGMNDLALAFLEHDLDDDARLLETLEAIRSDGGIDELRAWTTTRLCRDLTAGAPGIPASAGNDPRHGAQAGLVNYCLNGIGAGRRAELAARFVAYCAAGWLASDRTAGRTGPLEERLDELFHELGDPDEDGDPTAVQFESIGACSKNQVAAACASEDGEFVVLCVVASDPALTVLDAFPREARAAWKKALAAPGVLDKIGALDGPELVTLVFVPAAVAPAAGKNEDGVGRFFDRAPDDESAEAACLGHFLGHFLGRGGGMEDVSLLTEIVPVFFGGATDLWLGEMSAASLPSKADRAAACELATCRAAARLAGVFGASGRGAANALDAGRLGKTEESFIRNAVTFLIVAQNLAARDEKCMRAVYPALDAPVLGLARALLERTDRLDPLVVAAAEGLLRRRSEALAAIKKSAGGKRADGKSPKAPARKPTKRKA